jgi:gluconate kinase
MSEFNELKASSYVVLLSGTHVTGKETLAVSLSKSLGCPWLKAEHIHASASFGARSQEKKGYNYGGVFGRIWFSKLRRLGFLADGNESDGELEVDTCRKLRTAPRKPGSNCTALISCFAMRKPARDAIRDVMLAHDIRAIFTILHITEETLFGRTLGAEEPELAERIMGEKIADIQKPFQEERDVILIDSMKDVDALFSEIRERIMRQLTNSEK